MSTLDADTLATLTPEEREAIESAEMSPEELAAMQRIAGSDNDDDTDAGNDDAGNDDAGNDDAGNDDAGNDDAGNDDDGNDVAAAAGAASNAAADGGAAAAAAARPAAQAPDAAAPRYEAKLPDNFDQQVKTLADREAELKRQFRTGEIEFDEYEEQRSQLLTKREALTIARTKAEISQEMTVQTAERQWKTTVNRFLDAAAKDGLDYRGDAAKMGDLDLFVKTLAQRTEYADKPPEWFLQEADRRVRALYGMSTPQARRSDPVADATARRRVDPADAPRSLAQVPGSDGPGDVAGEFADVDALGGDDLEMALARMTPAQREKYALGR
jgi:hypothetical protein